MPSEKISGVRMKPLSSQMHTHYDNLKVARNAPPEVIRAAYKILGQKFHPDRHGGDARATHTFQLITAAYEVLSDPQRRRQHDEWIARRELQLQREMAAADEARTKRPWNGKERRRRPWAELRSGGAATGSTAAASTLGAMRIPARTLAFWIALALVTLMLLTLLRP